MRLVAIYIKEHEYLFDKPQTINFGGKFLYTFEEKTREVIVSRKENEQFIDDFFNLENDTANITMISAVVGQNGAGKSSLMDVIRGQYIKYKPCHYEALFLFEDDNADYPSIHNYCVSDKVLLRLDESNENFKELKDNEQTHQSIYYSPQFDYKFNVSFDNTDSYDLSFDKYLELDLKEISAVSTNSSGWAYTPSQELLFKNSLRQIEFLNSDLVKERSIFNNIFHLPEHGKPLLTFRGYKPREDYREALNYQPALQHIKKEINNEISNIHRDVRILDEEGRPTNQLEINKYLLKRRVLKCAISIVEEQIERDGTYFSYDSFDKSLFDEEFAKIESSYEKEKSFSYLCLFIELCKLIGTEGEKVKTFDIDVFKNLMGKIYTVIDSCSSEDEVGRGDELYCTKEQAIEILTAQKEFLSDLFLYYHKRIGSSKLTDGDRIGGFVHYMPFRTSLSSGENALLNLFSKLFTFLNDNLVTNNFLEAKDHYILILDEGDLGFHPTWKKKYIYALCKTLPYFFDLIPGERKPTFQIIITTHDSLTLSDLPNSNVVYMERRSYEEKSNVLNYHDKNRPTRTFGANITDLLADSFFIEESLMGNFAHEKIRDTIEWLNSEDQDESDKFKTIIDMIDEPILQRKLSEMYDEKMGTKLKMEIIDKQIEYLEKLKEKLN